MYPKLFYEQLPPEKNNEPLTWGLVIQDMVERNRIGMEKYGTPLQAFNGRDSLQDAYEEVLDLCVYLKNELIKRERERDEHVSNSRYPFQSFQHTEF